MAKSDKDKPDNDASDVPNNSAVAPSKKGLIPGIKQVIARDSRAPELPLPLALWAKTVGLSAGFIAQSAQLTAQFFHTMAKTALGVGRAWQESYKRYFTANEIEKWVDYDAEHHMADDGTSPGGRYYVYVKEQMQAALGTMPKGWGEAVKRQLKDNQQLQELMRNNEMAEQFERVDATIREIYHRKYPERAANMRWCGTLCDKQFNNQFLTEHSRATGEKHGKIEAVDVDKIVALFQPKNQGNYAHVLMTFSHAQGETLNDVMSITHGVEAMARDSEGEELPHGYIDKGVKPGQTLTLYACDVEETPWRNGAALLRRVNELKRLVRTGEPEQNFNEVSPGAKRVAKLILKCMAEDPSQIDVNDARPMREIAAKAKTPVRLRADAVDIAHHFQLVGYSKGGNVASDALRYLVSELTARNAVNQDVFNTHEDAPVQSAGHSMNPHNVRNIVRSISLMALAAVEVKMSDHDKAYGVCRVAINNQHDLISAHHNYEGSMHDERWIIEGIEEHHGHAPHQFMGSRKLSEEFEARGYAHEDGRVARRLKEFYAPNYGKAAVGHVLFNGRAHEGEVTIEAATGTTDKQLMQYNDVINAAFARAGLVGARFENDPEHPGMFNLSCRDPQSDEPVDLTKNVAALTKIQQAFEYLKRPEQKGLVIAQAIISDEIGGQIARAKAANGPSYWASRMPSVRSQMGRWVA